MQNNKAKIEQLVYERSKILSGKYSISESSKKARLKLIDEKIKKLKEEMK